MYEKFFTNKLSVSNEVTGEQNVDQNALQGSTSPKTTLWSVALEEAIDATRKVLVPIASTTYDVQEGFRYLPASAGEAKPNIQVMVITDAGSVEHDGTSDWHSSMSSKIVSVPLTRFSKSFGISAYDAEKGFAKTAAQVAALVNTIKADIVKEFAKTLDNAATNEVEVSEITPATIAHKVSAAFGDYGDVESLVLTPANYAELTPDSALSLKLENGAYGIGAIYKSAGIPSGTEGLVYNKDAVACALARPAFAELPGCEIYDFESDGIPFRLKVSADADRGILYHTVDTLCGFAIANDRHLAKVVIGD